MILMLHALSTLSLVGLIWFVQLVHYPLFVFADRTRFGDFASAHRHRTTLLVAPLMLTEATTAIALTVSPPAGSASLAWLGCALLAVVWLSTAFLQVPQHRILASGFRPEAAQKLVRSNWIRTIAWTARGVIALILFSRGAAP